MVLFFYNYHLIFLGVNAKNNAITIATGSPIGYKELKDTDKKGVEQRGGGSLPFPIQDGALLTLLGLRENEALCNLHVLKIQAHLYTLLVSEHLLFQPKIYSIGICPSPKSHC